MWRVTRKLAKDIHQKDQHPQVKTIADEMFISEPPRRCKETIQSTLYKEKIIIRCSNWEVQWNWYGDWYRNKVVTWWIERNHQVTEQPNWKSTNWNEYGNWNQ